MKSGLEVIENRFQTILHPVMIHQDPRFFAMVQILCPGQVSKSKLQGPYLESCINYFDIYFSFFLKFFEQNLHICLILSGIRYKNIMDASKNIWSIQDLNQGLCFVTLLILTAKVQWKCNGIPALCSGLQSSTACDFSLHHVADNKCDYCSNEHVFCVTLDYM